MKKTIQFIGKVLDNLLSGQIDVSTWFLGFSGIMAVRELIKSFLATPSLSLLEVVTDYVHELMFFGITFLLVWFFLSFILNINILKLSKAFFWASWIVIFPPLIDMLKTGGSIYWSFYLLGSPTELWREFTSFFSNFPPGIVYFGTKIMITVVIVLTGIIAYYNAKKALTALVAMLGTYIIFFFMAAFPAFFAFGYFYLTKGVGYVNAIDQIQLFGGTPSIFGISFAGAKYSLAYNLNLIFYPLLFGLLLLFFLAYDKQKIKSILKNLRYPQLIYHFGLLFMGMGLGFLAYPSNFNLNLFSFTAVIVLLISIFLAWEASVIVNDIFDFAVDKVSNAWRPLPQGIYGEKAYKQLGYAFFGLSLLGGLVVGFKFMAILFVYQFLAWAYSANPYRLKRIPILATLLSAAASLLILFIGFALLSGDYNLTGLSWKIVLLLLIALTISLPIKDFKDIEGDRKYGIWTIPVLFGEEKGRLIVATSIFISFMLSVFMLNEFKLFWWAILFGGLSFWFIVLKKTHQLFWWVLIIVSVYGLVLVKTLFL